jgi:transposase
MPALIKLEPHLTTEALEKRYRDEKDGVGRSHWQILWLLSSGKRTGEVAQATGYSVPWIRSLIHRYNAQGPEAVGDRRHHNGGHGRLLSSEQEGALKAELERAQAQGQAWNGPQVTDWMSAQVGRALNKARGWDMLQRLGYTSKTPRPRHAKADAQTQHDFKKTSA